MQDTSASQSLRCLGVQKLRAWMFSGLQSSNLLSGIFSHEITIKGRKNPIYAQE